MNETTVAMVGNVASELRFRRGDAGVPVVSFRFASTARRFDRRGACWVDGDTSFVTVWAFRNLAENVAGSVGRGDPLVVAGRLRVRDWRQEGERRTAVEIDARSIGHDLARGTTAFRRVLRGDKAEAFIPIESEEPVEVAAAPQ